METRLRRPPDFRRRLHRGQLLELLLPCPTGRIRRHRPDGLPMGHLPQVAAIGDNHIYIYKEIQDGRTKTSIKELNKSERVEEIAKMLSGDSISLYALEHAKELIENNK